MRPRSSAVTATTSSSAPSQRTGHGQRGQRLDREGTSDGAPGDNFDPLGNDPIVGHDIYIGTGENDKFIAEGGDDIMVGSPGLGDRYIGGSGFDWATFKSDPLGVTVDLTDAPSTRRRCRLPAPR